MFISFRDFLGSQWFTQRKRTALLPDLVCSGNQPGYVYRREKRRKPFIKNRFFLGNALVIIRYFSDELMLNTVKHPHKNSV